VAEVVKNTLSRQRTRAALHHDPLIHRFYERLSVYGTTLKEPIHGNSATAS